MLYSLNHLTILSLPFNYFLLLLVIIIFQLMIKLLNQLITKNYLSRFCTYGKFELVIVLHVNNFTN